ncbi:MAG: hypothetical protein IJ124_03660, partial [Clostridia bacterium]|nr:hypothetical protein [Clostridia bacterium]
KSTHMARSLWLDFVIYRISLLIYHSGTHFAQTALMPAQAAVMIQAKRLGRQRAVAGTPSKSRHAAGHGLGRGGKRKIALSCGGSAICWNCS